MKTLELLADFFLRHERFFLATHVNPDGDALGSTLALALGLKALGKEVWPFLEEGLPRFYCWLPRNELFRFAFPEGLDWAGVVLDCGDLSRVGEAASFVSRLKEVVVIDHHEVSGELGTLRLVEPVCATGVLVFELLKLLKVELTPELAQNLYVALFSDTGGFRYRETNARAFEMARQLTEAGAEPALVAERLTERYPLSRFCLLRLVLERMKILAEGRVVVSLLTAQDFQDCGAQKLDAEDLATFLRGIDGVEVTALVKEFRPGEVSVSLRSRGGVNVALFAREFGGGGHRCAAGFKTKGEAFSLFQRLSQRLEALFS